MDTDDFIGGLVHDLIGQGCPPEVVAEVVADTLGVDFDEGAARAAEALLRPRPDVDIRTYVSVR